MKNIRIKNKASVLVFAAVLSMGVFSCKTELLDPIPKDRISDVVAFDTPERIALQVNNNYTAVKNGNFLGGRAFIYGDVRANDFINRTTNGVTAYLVWQHTINEASQNDVINLWTFAYQAINQINVFLDGMEANADKFVAPLFPATFASTTAPQYIAEARFLRAVSYHYLLQFYARPFADNAGGRPGLPLRLQGEKSSANNDLARATVAEVYNQIIDDLNFAEANLPDTYADALTRITRAHKNTAIAFKTRVYLTKGDYANVIAEANKIVSATAPFAASTRVPHALQANIADVFAAPQETPESIFSMPFSAQNGPGGQSQLGFYYRATSGTNVGGGEFSLNQGAGSIVADNANFLPTDARRTNFVYLQGTESYLGKYPSGTPYLDKAPVMRWSEVLLNLSEALARTGTDQPKAIALLNEVRTRSTGAAGLRAPATQAELIDNVLTERRIEFLGEGLRNQDIMRLQAPFPGKGSVGEVVPSNAAWVWPIPITELNANLLCERN